MDTRLLKVGQSRGRGRIGRGMGCWGGLHYKGARPSVLLVEGGGAELKELGGESRNSD